MSRTELKYKARLSLAQTRPSPFITALVCYLVLLVLNNLNKRLTAVTIDAVTLRYIIETGHYEYLLRYYYANMPTIMERLIGFLLSLMTTMMSAGFLIYTLHVVRGEPSSFRNLLDGFEDFPRIIWLSILQTILVWLWSMLFVIPGIIASYRYRMALYILVDNPDMSAMQCLRESKRMMRGHKAELFIQDLSFFGWEMLSIIPFVSVYTMPYIGLTRANYYEELLANYHRVD